MNHSLPLVRRVDKPGELSTILSVRVPIPITCDECGYATDVSIERLKEHIIVCEHCASVRQFSAAEMRLLRLLLAQSGYHVTC